MKRMLTIGEFAERCGLSRSALRFYDQNGLVEPSAVDPGTGYRYYAREQEHQASLVRRLREAEMPVGEVREYLAADPGMRRVLLDAHAVRLRLAARAVDQALDALRAEAEACGAWFEIAAPAFALALARLTFALPVPGDRDDLDGVWIELRDGSLRMVATDSYRLVVRDMLPRAAGPEPVRGLISGAGVRDLQRTLAQSRTLTVAQAADGEISLLADGLAAASGGFSADFPDYEELLAGVPAGDQITLVRAELEGALAGLSPAADSWALSCDRPGLEICDGSARARVGGTWSGGPLTVHLKPRFMVEAVAATVGPDLLLEVISPLKPVTIRSADTGTVTVLTMPVRP